MEGIFEKIGIDSGIVIIAILVAMLVLILIVLVLVARVRDISNKYTNFMRGEDGKSLERSVERRFQEVGTVVRSQAAQSSRMQFIEAIQNRSLTRYGIVKYDAFDDVGGKLSFALAMLDRNDTGFVLNAIHSKENCYLYLKEVVKGESYIMLSHEEIEALRAAKKYGSEEEAILKYQLDKAVRSERNSAKKLQEMKKPRRKPSSSNPYARRTNMNSSLGEENVRRRSDADTGRHNANAGAADFAVSGAVVAGAAAAAYSAGANASKSNEENKMAVPPSAADSEGYETTSYTNSHDASGYDASPAKAYVHPGSYDASGYVSQTSLDASSYTKASSFGGPAYESQPGYEMPPYSNPSAYDQPVYTPPQEIYDAGALKKEAGNIFEADPVSSAGNGAALSYSEPAATVPIMSEIPDDGMTAAAAGRESSSAYVVPGDQESGILEPEIQSVKGFAKSGGRKNGQPPRKTKRNKNRKNYERKDQGHAGH